MFTDRATLEAHIKAVQVTGSPRQMRAAFEVLAGPSAPATRTDITGVPCAVFGTGDPVLWLHGGGYVFGSGDSHANVARALVDQAGCRVVVPEYRLAPEHPWPAALQDVRVVWGALGGDTPIVGDSAGGHLALNLALDPYCSPRAVVLVSPNTDRTGRSTTRRDNSATDLMNDDAQDAALARMAFGDMAVDDPSVSPILADLSSLPRTYLTASDTEVLFGDVRLLVDALHAADVPVTFDVVRGIFHMWPLWPDATPQARATVQAIARFLAR